MIRLLPFLFLVFFLSCGGKQKRPEGLLSTEKMSAVLWDAMRADELVSLNYINRKDSTFKVEAYRSGLYQEVFRLHATSRAVFDRSLKYYQAHPDLMKVMLDDLQKRAENAQVKKDTGKLSTKPSGKITDTTRKLIPRGIIN